MMNRHLIGLREGSQLEVWQAASDDARLLAIAPAREQQELVPQVPLQHHFRHASLIYGNCRSRRSSLLHGFWAAVLRFKAIRSPQRGFAGVQKFWLPPGCARAALHADSVLL